MDEVKLNHLINSCKPIKKRGRPSHKRQIQDIRNERRINLQTSDSVLTTINLRSILTLPTLKLLPENHQLQLIRLLPEMDQMINEETGKLEPRDTALSNEHFTHFCSQYLEKLSNNTRST